MIRHRVITERLLENIQKHHIPVSQHSLLLAILNFNFQISDHDAVLLLAYAPKIQNGCIPVNISTDTLFQSLVSLAMNSNFANKRFAQFSPLQLIYSSQHRIVEYLLEFSQHMFDIKVNSQTLSSKHYQASEVLEFKIIHNLNKFLDHFLKIEETKANVHVKNFIK